MKLKSRCGVWTAYRRIGKIMRIVGHMPAIPDPFNSGQIIMVVSVLFPPEAEALPSEASTLDRS